MSSLLLNMRFDFSTRLKVIVFTVTMLLCLPAKSNLNANVYKNYKINFDGASAAKVFLEKLIEQDSCNRYTLLIDLGEISSTQFKNQKRFVVDVSLSQTLMKCSKKPKPQKKLVLGSKTISADKFKNFGIELLIPEEYSVKIEKL